MKRLWMLWLLGFCAAGMPGRASAGALDPREIALMMESTIVDLDLTAIAATVGTDPTSHLTYVSRIDEGGWQGRLFGTYGGQATDIYYIGTLTPVGGASNAVDIAYTSSWVFGGNTAAGSGTAAYHDPEFGFSVDLANLSVSGSASVSYGVVSATLTGTKNLSTSMLTLSGTISAIDLPLLGSAAEGTVSLSYNQLTGAYTSELEASVLFGLFSASTTIDSGSIVTTSTPPPPPPMYPNPPPTPPYPGGSTTPGFGAAGTPGFNNMSVSSVPEPAGLVSLGLGMALVACVAGARAARTKRAA